MVQDANGNTLKYESVRAAVFKYKYVSADATAGASGVGTVSVYAMFISMGSSLALSLILYGPTQYYTTVATRRSRACGRP